MRAFTFAAVIVAVAAPAFADETTGKIAAFDRKAGVIVLTDKTIWSLENVASMPEGVEAGDTIHMIYETAGEDGLIKIDSLKVVTN